MAFELPGAIYSPELLESVIYEIESYVEWYRSTVVQKKVGAVPTEEPSYSEETVLTIEAWMAGEKPTLEKLEALIAYLRALKLPVVHVMLAALPNHAQRASLVDWFRGVAGPNLLLSFVADRNIGGGVVVRTPNRVFDYSWRQRLIEGRDKMAGIINRV